MAGTTEVVLEGLVFPECPRWRPDGLWFSDMHANHVQRIGLDGTAEVMVDVPDGPAGLGWLPDGTLVVVSMHSRQLLRVDDPGSATAVVTVLAEMAGLHAGHSNDMVVDGLGRCYIGNIGYDIHGGEAVRPTVLVLVEPGSAAPPRVVADGLVTPNGMVVTPGGERLIVAESMAHRLTSFALGEDGSLTDRRLFADLDGETPDGICLDVEGAVWFASIGRREVVRVTEGGTVTDRVSSGDRRVLACMLGGDDRRDLYLVTAGSINPEKALAMRAGTVERCRVEVPGAGLP